MRPRLPVLTGIVATTILLAGCFLAANREINLLVVRTETGGSEVTVTYRVPPPKAGTFYILWLLNPDEGKQVRVGIVEPSAQLRAIKTRVSFWATGAVVSIESAADVQEMSNDSVLTSGQTEKSTITTRTQ